MKDDIVTQLLQQWAIEHPEKDSSALGVVVRIQMLAKLLQRRSTRALAVHGLKHWEYDVLSVLRRQGEPFELPATEIAKESVLTTGAMTTRIDGLQERGLLRRKKNRNDGRSVLVRLTAKGHRLVDAAIDTRLRDADEVLASMSTKERKQIADALRQLGAQIDGGHNSGARSRRVLPSL